MDQDAQHLLEQIKSDQRRTSDRMHRDARRQTTLKAASLMLGQGCTAAHVRTWLQEQHLTLVHHEDERLVNFATKIAELGKRSRFDRYGRD